MDTYYVTFGTAHNEAHPLLQVPPTRRLSEGYIAIEAPDYDTARRLANVLLGITWAFMYGPDDKPEAQFVPDGELFRLAWINHDRHATLGAAIEATYRAADGGSNDKEIELLQQARDLLEEFIETKGDET